MATETPIDLITNSAWAASARVFAASVSDVPSDVGTPFENTVGGGRHLSWTASDTGTKHFYYINMNGGLGCDRMVMTLANAQIGNNLKVVTWPVTFPSGGTVVDSRTLALGDMVGPTSQDFVYSFSPAVSGKYALGLELLGSNTKKIGKLYFGTALSMKVAKPPVFSPYWHEVQIYRQVYLVDWTCTIVFDELTAAQVQTLENVQLANEPFFLYDSAGFNFRDKLWHGVLAGMKVEQIFNDKYVVSVQTMRLRHY